MQSNTIVRGKHARSSRKRGLGVVPWILIAICVCVAGFSGYKIYQKYAEQLMVFDSPDPVLCLEWKAFAEKWIRTCLSRQYRSAGFGVISMRDEAVAGKIAREINTVTRDIPRRFSKEDSFLPLRKILIEVYKHEIADSDDIFNV